MSCSAVSLMSEGYPPWFTTACDRASSHGALPAADGEPRCVDGDSAMAGRYPLRPLLLRPGPVPRRMALPPGPAGRRCQLGPAESRCQRCRRRADRSRRGRRAARASGLRPCSRARRAKLRLAPEVPRLLENARRLAGYAPSDSLSDPQAAARDAAAALHYLVGVHLHWPPFSITTWLASGRAAQTRRGRLHLDRQPVCGGL